VRAVHACAHANIYYSERDAPALLPLPGAARRFSASAFCSLGEFEQSQQQEAGSAQLLLYYASMIISFSALTGFAFFICEAGRRFSLKITQSSHFSCAQMLINRAVFEAKALFT
jgi:hypothetical protein